MKSNGREKLINTTLAGVNHSQNNCSRLVINYKYICAMQETTFDTNLQVCVGKSFSARKIDTLQDDKTGNIEQIYQKQQPLFWVYTCRNPTGLSSFFPPKFKL